MPLNLVRIHESKFVVSIATDRSDNDDTTLWALEAFNTVNGDIGIIISESSKQLSSLKLELNHFQ
jgi:hypothetical protein